MSAHSNRAFQLLWLEGDATTHIEESLNDILANEKEYEYMYSLQDRIDDLLDMDVDEVIFHQFIRDDSTRKGVIRRSK